MNSPQHSSIRMTSEAPDHSIPEVLDRVKHGRFHFMLVALCGLCCMSDSTEMIFQYFIPRFELFAEAEQNFFKPNDMVMALIIGQAIGALFWGSLADHKGRKLAFVGSLGGTLIGGLLRAAVPALWVMMALQLLVGFCSGGYFIAIDLVMEVSPTANRAKFVLILAMFWTLGTVWAAITGTLIFGFVGQLYLGSIGWRVFAIMVCFPCIRPFIEGMRWIPESPFWLQANGEPGEAKQVLQKIADDNRHQLEAFMLREQAKTVENKICNANIFRHLFAPYLRRKTLLLCILWFCLGVCFNGFSLLLESTKQESRAGQEQDIYQFQNFMATVCFQAVGVSFAVRSVDRAGRRYSAVILLGLFVACSIMVGGIQLPSSLLSISLLAALGLIYSAGAILWVWTPELFLTEVRATGHGLATCLGRTGFTVSYFLYDGKDLALAAWTFGFFGLIGTIAAYALHVETAGLELDCFSRQALPSLPQAFALRYSALPAVQREKKEDKDHIGEIDFE